MLLAQWLPGRALEQVLAAVKGFHQTSQSLPASHPQLDSTLQQSGSQLKPRLWLQCRLQAGLSPGNEPVLLHCSVAPIRRAFVTYHESIPLESAACHTYVLKTFLIIIVPALWQI